MLSLFCMVNWKNLSLILISVLLIDAGQLLLKYSLNTFGEINWGFDLLFSNFILIAQNPFVWLALFLMGLSSFTWLLALSKNNLSYAYPILSFGYVVVAVLSWVFFSEPMGMVKILGLGIIAMGVVMLSNT